MPTITLRFKRLGKKRIKNRPYELPVVPDCLRALIHACVQAEVERFNASREDPMVLRFLTPEDIGKGAMDGKITFGELHNVQKTDLAAAGEAAIQGWKDGLFAVFHGETELLDLDDPMGFAEGDEITFIRLTFLAGLRW